MIPLLGLFLNITNCFEAFFYIIFWPLIGLELFLYNFDHLKMILIVLERV